VMVAIIIAVKFSCDKFPSNKAMAASVGLSLSELNKLEVKFLCGIGYDLTVSARDMETALVALGMRAESRQVSESEDSDYVVDSGAEEEAARKNYNQTEAAKGRQQPAISNNYEHGVDTSGDHLTTITTNSNNCEDDKIEMPSKRQRIELTTSGESVDASPGWSEASAALPAPAPTVWPPEKLADQLAMQSSCCIEMSAQEKLGAYVLAATAAE